jgi:hypothetical protein
MTTIAVRRVKRAQTFGARTQAFAKEGEHDIAALLVATTT